MADKVFDLCVVFLIWLGNVTGTTYKEINVIVFCVLWPIFTLILTVACIIQFVKIRNLKKALQDKRT
ncbi:MAG: hypothetical protein ABIJ56_08620 [Pseudomonadota bacterium]